MKRLALVLFILFMVGCKKASGKPEQVFAKADTAGIVATVPESDKLYTCEDIIREIVVSSDAEVVKKFKNVFIRLENISEEKITVELYTENNLSDSPNQKQMVENAVAWLEFFPKTNQLKDITLDAEDPRTLSFDKNILTKHNLSAACGIKSTPESTPEKISITTNCKEIMEDMMSGEECLIPEGSISSVYKEIVSKKLVTDSKYLLKELPSKTTSFPVNENGLVKITYTVTEKSTDIEMEYLGGVTGINLKKEKKGIKRTITKSAD